MQYWRMSPMGEGNDLILNPPDDEDLLRSAELGRGERQPQGGVVHLTRHMGARQPDMLYASRLTPVSVRFVETLEAAGATGWSTLPISVEGRPDLDRKYRLLVVHGRCGPVEHGRGGYRKTPIGDGRNGRYMLKRVGMWFDAETWDGSDVFYPSPGTTAIVTQKVVDAIKTAKLKGIELVPIEEVLTIDPNNF